MSNDDLSRTRILIYQYLMFKGDFYKNQAMHSLSKLKQKPFKDVSLSEIDKAHLDLEIHLAFESFASDLINLLDL